MLDKIKPIPQPQRLIAVLWLSFLMAAAATGCFFSVIDPIELRNCVTFPELPRFGAYTVGFLLFWLLTASSSLLTIYFLYPTDISTSGN